MPKVHKYDVQKAINGILIHIQAGRNHQKEGCHELSLTNSCKVG